MDEAAAFPLDAPEPGAPYPLGATWDGAGVNFALFGEHAEGVELCLFDRRGRERQRIPLRERTDHVWHGRLPQARPGLAYGYRVHGPYRPHEGLRFNPHKLLMDPYAKEIAGALRWSDALYGYTIGHKKADLSFDRRDSAAHMPKARVAETAFSWGEDRRPNVPWADTVIYEMHVKAFGMRTPGVPDALRGSYAALATPAAIAHLRRLGVTAVELLPVQAFVDDRHLVERGLRNHWGYNPLAWCAPEPRYTAGPASASAEFKAMVRALHAAGIEVILDVVYNHSCEGNELGPTLSLRGLDNPAYYRLADDRRYHHDVTGCGNTLNLAHPRVLQMAMDSLRYWVQEMHVDGFRFDLASALLRGGSFLDAVRQDPVLNGAKLIAEPWDLGSEGYRLGGFPGGWSEWNDRYRDGVRAFWRGDEGTLGEFARRLSGSADLFEHDGRRPAAGINFVTAHDGFTLADLVSYSDKHNEANGEDNRDGHAHNLSWNCGVEGPSDDDAVLALRARAQRNLLATLLLSQGVPMLLAGDELGRTQRGNNNAYAQDNPTSWLDWTLPGAEALSAFTARLIALRREHPGLRRREFFGRGRSVRWLHPEGTAMDEARWNAPRAACVGMLIEAGPMGDDDDLLLLFNAQPDDVAFTLPEQGEAAAWRVGIDTSRDAPGPALSPYPLSARSLALLLR